MCAARSLVSLGSGFVLAGFHGQVGTVEYHDGLDFVVQQQVDQMHAEIQVPAIRRKILCVAASTIRFHGRSASCKAATHANANIWINGSVLDSRLFQNQLGAATISRSVKPASVV